MIPVFVEVERSIKNAVEKMPKRPKYFDFRLFVTAAITLIFGLSLYIIDAPTTLDTHFYYSKDEFILFFKSLKGKEFYRYLINEFFDVGFIFSYAAFLFLSLKRLVYKKPKAKYMALIPAGFDLAETSIIILILIGEFQIKNFTWLGLITSLKWLSAILVVLFYFLALSFRILKKNNS